MTLASRTEHIEVALSTTSLEIPEEWTFEEWAAYGKTLARMTEGIMWWIGDWWRYGEARYGERAAQALEVGMEYKTFADAARVSSRFPELSRRRESLPWGHHREVAALEPATADTLLDQAEQQHWSNQDLRSAVKTHKFREKRQNTARIEAQDTEPLPENMKFPILLADPPWQYDYAEDSGRAIENHYPTMPVEEIMALDVPAADDAMLFLWATSPKLREAFAVIEAWGFEYRTCAVWVKDRIGMGYYFRQQHELLLLAKRGNLPAPVPASRPPSLIYGDRLGHSQKPDTVYDLIEFMYPGYTEGEFCELFCRGEPRKGWYGWGNESA